METGRKARDVARPPEKTRRPKGAPASLQTLGVIALGGALGTVARVALARTIPTGPGFPWATFVVNMAGSFVLGAGSVAVLERFGPTRRLWPFFATGVCGSFTTFSTFAVEVDLRLRSGDVVVGLAYAVVSVALGLLAVVAGIEITRAALGRRTLAEERTRTASRRRSWN